MILSALFDKLVLVLYERKPWNCSKYRAWEMAESLYIQRILLQDGEVSLSSFESEGLSVQRNEGVFVTASTDRVCLKL
jgi:hypothetical protein